MGTGKTATPEARKLRLFAMNGVKQKILLDDYGMHHPWENETYKILITKIGKKSRSMEQLFLNGRLSMVPLELRVPRKLNQVQDVSRDIHGNGKRQWLQNPDNKKLLRISGTGWVENIKILVIFHNDVLVKPCSSG